MASKLKYLWIFIRSRQRWFIFIIALIIRLLYVFQLEDKWYYYDTVHYDTAAQSIIKGEGFGPGLYYDNEYQYYALEPTFPIFLAAIYQLFGHHFIAVRLVHVLLSLVHLLILYQLAKQLSERTGQWVMLVGAVYPYFIYITGLLYVTQLFTLLLTLTVYHFFLYYDKGSLKYLFFGSLWLGLSAVTKPVMIPAVFLFAAWILLLPNHQFKTRIKHAGLLFAMTILLLVPWTIRNYLVFDVFAPGRACMAEKRVLNGMRLYFERKEALNKKTLDGTTFSVQFDSTETSHLWNCYVDDSLFAVIEPPDNFNVINNKYIGLFFYGGKPLSLTRFRAWKQKPEKPILDTFKNKPLVNSAELTFSDTCIIVDSTKEKWDYAAVYSAENASYLEMTFTQPVKPKDIQRIAFWIDVNEPSLDASGIMIWLRPWRHVDVWSVKNGQPESSIPVKHHYENKESFSILDLMHKYPIQFFRGHFIEEFIKFWSPAITRITTHGNNPGKLAEQISILCMTPLLVLFPFGLYRCRKKVPCLLLFLIPMLTVSLGYSIFFAEIRYRIPVDAFLIILAVYGFEGIFNKVTRFT